MLGIVYNNSNKYKHAIIILYLENSLLVFINVYNTYKIVKQFHLLIMKRIYNSHKNEDVTKFSKNKKYIRTRNG